MININGLNKDTTIRELQKMEEELKNFPELQQIKNTMEAKNKGIETEEETTEDLFKKLGVAYYE